MNSSARITAVILLAAAALGGAVFGCTVTSGTVNDTDGGTQIPDPTTDSGTTDPDTGTGNTTPDSGATCAAASKQTKPIRSAKCQACLNTKCCTAMTACYDLPAPDASFPVDCNAYQDCIRTECDENPNAGADCDELCKATAADGVAAAFEALEACGDGSGTPGPDNCLAECSE